MFSPLLDLIDMADDVISSIILFFFFPSFSPFGQNVHTVNHNDIQKSSHCLQSSIKDPSIGKNRNSFHKNEDYISS